LTAPQPSGNAQAPRSQYGEHEQAPVPQQGGYAPAGIKHFTFDERVSQPFYQNYFLIVQIFFFKFL